ncbi:hypothetical protein ABZY19_38735 [Streptomyces sp. NPDC006475]|uniref:hypothetical protein n=1 Tax=Streptomyces sp. NPDC006475 TaxID=3155719 RepID=UPI0033B9D004
MRARGRRRIVGVAAALLAVAGCGGEPVADAEGPPASPTSPSHAPFDQQVVMDGGRRVGMYYSPGRGLMEQHVDPGDTAWSKPHVVHRTTADPCGSMKLMAFDGVVAVIADWGPYCADGEPPTESLAAVGEKNRSVWHTEVTANFDGWEKVTASGNAQQLTFTRRSVEWLTQLRWDRANGFAEVEDIRR